MGFLEMTRKIASADGLQCYDPLDGPRERSGPQHND